MRKEVWKDVPGWEEFYSVSSFGRVKRKQRHVSFMCACRHGGTMRMEKTYKEKLLKPNTDSGGYSQVVLQSRFSENPLKVTVTVHRLVLSAFRRLPGPEDHGMHRNDIRADNRLTNLKWGTKQKNHDDMMSKGRHKRGAVVRQLSEQEVLQVQQRPKDKLSDLAAEFGLSKSGISKIRAKAK